MPDSERSRLVSRKLLARCCLALTFQPGGPGRTCLLAIFRAPADQHTTETGMINVIWTSREKLQPGMMLYEMLYLQEGAQHHGGQQPFGTLVSDYN